MHRPYKVDLDQAYRDDEKNCQKLYSNPQMFFEIWAEEFINKMAEEKKKRRAKEKERRKNRQKTQEEQAGARVAKETVKIVPLWVSYLSYYKHLTISHIN